MAERPNVLLILVDQMMADMIGEGHPCRMEAVRGLAREGVTFGRAMTMSPHCCPSRATLMSGLYPSRHGVFNNVNTTTAFQYNLNDGVKLFSEFLAEAGYALAYAGKWHVARDITPGDRGWREYGDYDRGFLKRDNAQWLTREEETAPGPRPPGMMMRPGWGDTRTEGRVVAEGYRESYWYRTAVGPGLAALRDLAEGEQPWCLCVSTDMDHGNDMPAEVLAEYDGVKAELPASFGDPMLDKPRVYQRLRRQLWDQVSRAEAAEGLRHYWAMCTLQDWFVRDLLAELESTGQAENTAVVFVSDHGDYAYAHGLAVMGIAGFREAYHVPLVVRWPAGVAQPGRTIDEWVTLADLAPTLLELAGVQTSYPFSGRSLVPFLRDEATPLDWPDAWFSQTKGNECYYTQRIVATKEWKYVCNWFDFDELYDLRHDPHELVNLAFPSPEVLTCGSGDPPVARREEFQPWPPLAPELDAVRRELLGRMWRFALREHDIIFNAHPPVALPPYGPLVGLHGERPSASSAEVPEPRPPLPR